MKIVSVLLLVALGISPLRAQVHIHWLADSATISPRPGLLDQTHQPISQLLPDDGRMLNIRMKLAEQQSQFIRQVQRQLPDTAVMLDIRAYFSADGTAETAWLSSRSVLSAQQRERIAGLMQIYYDTYRYPVSAAAPFRETAIFRLDKRYVGQRSVRHGAGVVSTLEAARQTTRPDTVKIVSFSALGLTQLPDEVYRFPNLEELDLSKNVLRTLPTDLLARLPRLQRLILSFNQLDAGSLSFVRNRSLRMLNLQGNRLTYVPGGVRKNRRLQSLWLGNNPLTTVNLRGLRRLTDLNLYNAGLSELPRRIGRLRHLQVLDVYYNRLTGLPHSFWRLRKLEQLALAHNQLRSLPADIGRLTNLQQVYLHHNQLSQLPDQLSQLTHLRLLDLNNNWFSVVPPVLGRLTALEDLDMSNNNLQELPPTLTNLSNLKKLYLRSNPLTQTPARLAPYLGLIEQLEARQTEVFR